MNGEEFAYRLLLERLTAGDEDRRRQHIEHRELVVAEIERLEKNMVAVAEVAKSNALEIQKAKLIMKSILWTGVVAGVSTGAVHWRDLAALLLKTM